MNKVYGFIGLVLWVTFVHLIAPDLSYVRSLLASVVGVAAICLIAMDVPKSIYARSEDGEKTQSE